MTHETTQGRTRFAPFFTISLKVTPNIPLTGATLRPGLTAHCSKYLQNKERVWNLQEIKRSLPLEKLEDTERWRSGGIQEGRAHGVGRE
jgi:hypothetical protein